MDFAISTEGDGTKHAISAALQVTVLPDEDSYICHERTKPFFNDSGRSPTSFLKCRLDDVWVYILGTNIIITKQKLHIEDLT
jgi:hypothetical protein